MSPGALHPVEARARDLALVLFDCIDPNTRFDAAGIYLRPICRDLMTRGGLTQDAAGEHCAAIMARAEQIEAMGRPAPERERHPGLSEFLEQVDERIALLLR